MWFLISVLQGVCLYLQFQVIQGETKCLNEYWLQTTQSSKVPVGHTHEIPEESDMTVVFAYEVTCPLCVFAMNIIIEEGGMFTDVTYTGVQGILDHITDWKKRRDIKLREREEEWYRLNPTTTTTTTTTTVRAPPSESKSKTPVRFVPCNDPKCKTCPAHKPITVDGMAFLGALFGGLSSGSSSSYTYKQSQMKAFSAKKSGWGGSSSWKSSGSSWKSGGGFSSGKSSRRR